MTTTDKENIYKALVNLLTKHCDTCADKHQNEKILLSAFKLDLIEYAEENAIADVDELWESLARTLNVTLDNTIQLTQSNKCNCINGICSLC